MRRAFLPCSSVLFAALALAGCGGTPGTDDFVSSLNEARPELSEDDSRCVVTELQKRYDDERLADLISDSAADLSASDSAEFADAQFDAVRECDLEGQASPGLVSSFAAANALTPQVAECAVARMQEDLGFWELAVRLGSEEADVGFDRTQLESIFACGDRSAVVEQLRPQLIEQGISVSDAPCVAEALAALMEPEDLSVLYTGDMTDRFFELFLEAVEGCDALPPDPGN